MANFHDALGRVGGLAVIDIVGTIAGAEALVWLGGVPSRPLVYAFAFSAGYVAHELLRLRTPAAVLLRLPVNES